jgi:hypothetical protein
MGLGPTFTARLSHGKLALVFGLPDPGHEN